MHQTAHYNLTDAIAIFPLRWLRRLLKTAVICSILLIMPSRLLAARGQGTTVLIARDTQMSGFELRIKAELESAGFLVELFEIDFREDTRRILDLRAHARNAAAAIVCRQSAGVVEIWITDKVTNKSVLRRIRIPDDEDAEAFVAISTVELLRASLLEIYTVAELTGTVSPGPPVEQLIAPKPGDRNSIRNIARPRESRFALQINPAVFIARFKNYPLLNMQMAGAIRLNRHLELKIQGQTPILPQRIEYYEGDITIAAGYGAVGLNWILVYPRQIASADIGAGMAVLAYRVSGEPLAGSTGSHKIFPVPAPFISFGMDIRLVGPARIRLETLAGWSLSRIDISITNQDVSEKVAEIGYFFMSVGAGLMFLL